MNHYVYEITNMINGKKYIGKRSCNCDIDKDKYMGSGTIMKKAIEKYGVNNFNKEILGVFKSEKEAYEYEKVCIEKVKAWSSDEFYNLVSGGLGGTRFVSKETKLKLIKASKKSNKMRGLKHTDSSKEKIRLKTKKMWECDNHRANVRKKMLGREVNEDTINKLINSWDDKRRLELSARNERLWKDMEYRERQINARKEMWRDEDYRRKISESRKGMFEGSKNPMYGRKGELSPRYGKSSHNATKVVCVNTGEVFDTIKEAKCKYNALSIGECCSGKRKSSGKINGEPIKWKYYDEYIKEKKDNENK